MRRRQRPRQVFAAPAALRRLTAALLGLTAALPAAAQPAGEWRYFGGDAAFTRYSPLDQIDRENVGGLEIVWRRPGLDPAVQEAFPDLQVNAYLRSTPVMVDGVLYAPNAVGLLEAFAPATGENVWRARRRWPRSRAAARGGPPIGPTARSGGC